MSQLLSELWWLVGPSRAARGPLIARPLHWFSRATQSCIIGLCRHVLLKCLRWPVVIASYNSDTMDVSVRCANALPLAAKPSISLSAWTS